MIITMPYAGYRGVDCDQTLTVCWNGSNLCTDAGIRDRSNRSHWELSTGIVRALDAPLGTINGVTFYRGAPDRAPNPIHPVGWVMVPRYTNFRWTPVPAASNYEITLMRWVGFWQTYGIWTFHRFSTDFTFSCPHGFCGATPWMWTVRARNAFGFGPYSPWASFYSPPMYAGMMQPFTEEPDPEAPVDPDIPPPLIGSESGEPYEAEPELEEEPEPPLPDQATPND